MSTEISVAVTELLLRKIDDLKKKSPDELRALPEYLDHEEANGAVTLMTAIWKKALDGGRVQIVVQAYRTKGFGSYMTADGFILRADGTFDPLPEEVRLEYR